MKCLMYNKLRYLHKEGFYVFSVSFLKPKNKGWLEYSFSKTYTSKDTIEEEFDGITEKEYNRCQQILRKIAVGNN